MISVTITDRADQVEQIIEQALDEPVLVQTMNRESVVILSYAEFQRLRRIEEQHWIQEADKAMKSGFLTPEETMMRFQERNG